MLDVIFNGPEGRIEGKYYQSEVKNAPAVLVLHPHPLHGGTMNNKVVYNLFYAFVRKQFSVLRFNFRGVGRSSGKFGDGIGELADAASALDWLQLNNPNASRFFVAGFSFGALIALQLLMRRPELTGFVAISPPVNKYDFSFLSPCPASGLIVQGDNDSVVSEDAVSKLAARLAKQRSVTVDYHVIPQADHFFRTKMDELNEVLDRYTETLVDEDDNRPRRHKRDRRSKQFVDEE